MKNGTVYAARMKRAYARLRQSVPKPEIPESDDPLRRLAVGILAVGCNDDEAQKAIDRALLTMVDWNEIRVSSAHELHTAMGPRIPNGLRQCERLVAALQAVFDRENMLSLDRLRNIGRREVRQYLEELNGVDDYAVASVLLWSIGGHGIPDNDKLLKALRDADLVHPDAERGEVQAFFERHISASEAKEFCLVMRSFSFTKRAPKRRGTARRKKAPSSSKTKK